MTETHPASTDSPAEGGAVALGRHITMSPFADDVGNAVISPEEPDGPYWTLIAQGGEAEQNRIGAEIVRRLKANIPSPEAEPGLRENVGWVSEWTGHTGIRARAFHDTEEEASVNADWMEGRHYAVVAALIRPAATGTGESNPAFYRVGEFVGRHPVLCEHGNISPDALCDYCEGLRAYPGRLSPPVGG